MKTISAVLIGMGIWVLAVGCYTLSYQFQILEDLDLQAHFVLSTVVIPLVWLGSYLYYKKGGKIHGLFLGLIFFIVAAILDAVITVPLFVISNGGDYYTFFTDLGFWIIALELVAVSVLYYHIMVYPRTRILKAQ
ncbi:MAG: DUF5367 family protein [Bacteroidota bacterium]